MAIKTYSPDDLKKILADHALYLETRYTSAPKGQRANLEGANLEGANLEGANLEGANLGVKTPLARMLRLLGACDDAVAWAEKQPDTLSAMTEIAQPDWVEWARSRGIIL